MRRNQMGEVYCHDVNELRETIENSSCGWECYLSNIDPEDGDEKACGEVAENVSGDLVCYIEADTEAAVRAIAKEAKLDGS